MALYSMTFGFRQPYQVLVDSTMCKSASELKIELVKQLGTVLQGEIKPMITQCCIHELYLQGKSQQPTVDLAKTFERRKCNHREPIPGDDCVASVVGETNKHRYVIATQSQPLRVQLRTIPAVPLVHINRAVMVLEPPSDITIKTKEATEEQDLHMNQSDLALVGAPKTEPVQKKRKGPKGPNPLSIKKKQVARPPQDNKHIRVGEKRKRDIEQVEVEKNDDTAAVSEGITRKRRRRRKATD